MQALMQLFVVDTGELLVPAGLHGLAIGLGRGGIIDTPHLALGKDGPRGTLAHRKMGIRQGPDKHGQPAYGDQQHHGEQKSDIDCHRISDSPESLQLGTGRSWAGRRTRNVCRLVQCGCDGDYTVLLVYFYLMLVKAKPANHTHSIRMPEQIVPPPAAVGARRRVHWQHLVAAPHRVFFFGGVWALVLAVLWWGAVLAARHTALPPPAITLAPQWVHGWLMVFGSFTFFVFGFLMTALPRWVGAKPIAARIYCPVAIGLMCGYLLALLGGLWSTPVAAIGMGLTFLAWLAGVVTLARLFLVHNPERKMHPGWAIAVVGACCVAALAALFGTSTGHWTALADAPEFAAWAFLAAIVFVVFHRIGPFFSQGALDRKSVV